MLVLLLLVRPLMDDPIYYRLSRALTLHRWTLSLHYGLLRERPSASHNLGQQAIPI